jgi:hypothetical protein
MKYKFNEDQLVKELQEYVDRTYDQHYATDKYQATDIIIDSGLGTGFCLGNVLKYAKRYGNKGTPADARKDIMKILHYALIQLHIHDQEHKQQSEDRNPAYGPYPEYNSNLRQESEAYDRSYAKRLNDATPEEWNGINKNG